MRRGVVQRLEIVLEAPSHHVEIEAAAVNVGERRNLLRDPVRMHVDRLDRHQGAQGLRALDDDVGEEPRIQGAVVRVDEDAPASGFLAPACDLGEAFDVEVL